MQDNDELEEELINYSNSLGTHVLKPIAQVTAQVT